MKSIKKNSNIQMIPPGSYLEFNLNNHQKELFQYYRLEFPSKFTEDQSSILLIRDLLLD